MATKIIKFYDNNTTYVPVTLAKAVQFTYNTNKAMSVQEAIEQVAGSALSISSSVTSNATAIATHVGYNDIDFSYTSGTGVKISGVHTAKTKILKGEGLTYITESGNNIIIGTTATNNTGTVTKVSTTGAISGGDITTTGTISHAKQGPSNSGSTSVQQNSVNGTLSEGKSFKVAKLTINEYGHVTAATDVTYTMPSSFTPSAHDHTMALNGSADTTAQANNLVSVIKTLPGTLTTANSNAYTTYTVPTKEYVDEKIQSLGNALEYKGTIPAGQNAWPSGTPSTGDVWYFAGDNTINGQDYESGDMAMYNGTSWQVVNANWTAVDGTAALDWGQTTTLATIGGVTIDATMPAKPVLTTKKTGTGNVVTYVNATADHELTYYMGLTAVTTLSGTANSGVVTNLTQSGATLTVTSQSNAVTDAQATKASTDTTLGTTTTYVVTSVTESASGKISVTKTGIKIPAASNAFSNLSAGTDDTGNTAGTPNTGSAAADTAGDTIIFKGGNKWITTGVTDTGNADTVIINHAINSTTFEKTTADVYSIKIDNAGHITEATAAATGTVGIKSLSYSVSNASVDEFILFDGTWGTANNVAALTGDTTFVK